MKGSILFFAALSISYSSSTAQTVSELTSSEIVLNLKKLNTVGAVLYIAAHPDDENTRLLGYLAKEKKFRTGYLSLTRGDGGQNLIGKEQGELLGLIRTQELLAARRTDGAEQFFSRSNDFGYSKSPEETLTFWNKDSVLADAVWAIRKFKPDVIICRFPTTGEGGHGHHTASAIIALEAFDAAADPTKFPAQLKYTETWQAKRILWNTFNFGGTNTTSSDQLKIDVGVFNPLLGKSFGEIAAESRSMHKSQGFGSSRQRGSNTEYFKLLKGDPAKNDVFENMDFTWNRFKATGTLDKMIADCILKFDVQAPEKTVPAPAI
jgi:LmbE family N-acetylglucosaminyl deacetylase